MALNADRAGSLIEVARLVDHQHRLVVVEVFDDVVANIVPDGVRVSGGTAQQMLHTARGGLSGPLGDRPAVLAW
ncbi:hypothetical protein [Streptomyces sp. NPDC054786]